MTYYYTSAITENLKNGEKKQERKTEETEIAEKIKEQMKKQFPPFDNKLNHDKWCDTIYSSKTFSDWKNFIEEIEGEKKGLAKAIILDAIKDEKGEYKMGCPFDFFRKIFE